MMKVKDILKTEDDWVKGHYRQLRMDGKWRFCLMGAMKHCYSDDAFIILIREVQDYLEEHYHTRGPAVWNDHPEREFKEVKELVNVLDI
jgi:hypothetical protein